MLRKTLGARMRRLEELGLPRAPASPFEKRPSVCDPLLEALESGAVAARPGIARFDGKEVLFSDGSRERADLVVRHRLPPALSLPGPPPARHADDDLTLFLGTLHPRRHDLLIAGVSRPTGAFWPIAEVQARFAAALLTGRYALPSQAEIDRRSQPILHRRAFSPALHRLSVREELRRGERRAARAR